MALPIDVQSLENAAVPYDQIPDQGMKEAVKIWLLANIAGKQAMTPAQLVDAAKCYDCGIPDGMKKAVEIWLLAQIVG
jgi:hypothetical protein